MQYFAARSERQEVIDEQYDRENSHGVDLYWTPVGPRVLLVASDCGSILRAMDEMTREQVHAVRTTLNDVVDDINLTQA